MKKFHLTDTYALINFEASTCDSATTIIASKGFNLVLTRFIRKMRKEKSPLMTELKGIRASLFLDAYKSLLIWDYESLLRKNGTLLPLLKKRKVFERFTEAFYDDWRNLRRYGFLYGNRSYALEASPVATADALNEHTLYLYRRISENIRGRPFQVYRQLPAGVNANMVLIFHRWTVSEAYKDIQHVGVAQNILTRPPFMIYTKANTRSGLFKEIGENPLASLSINRLHYVCFPIRIGAILSFVYVHRDFLHHGIALGNLFEIVSYEDLKDQKPSIVYLYGIRENDYDGTFTYDKEEDIYLGFVSRNDKNDYFGYMKKMLLTLHNVYMIDRNRLPIHGAMVKITFKNQMKKHVVIMGDSGAGKSETLEALRVIGGDVIEHMDVVFDDMGVFFEKNGHVVSNGTETGAFVRLDDLDNGYAYQKMDRAIFMNPDQTNARVVLPVADHETIRFDHPVDMLLYANNYEKNEQGIRLFDSVEEALKIFRRGLRKAKGTTSEKGLVESFFANPFGPVQKRAQTETLLKRYFQRLAEDGIPIGEIHTELAIEGSEVTGPKRAAQELLERLLR